MIASHAILTSSYLATTSPLSNVPNIQTSRVIFPKTPILSNVKKKETLFPFLYQFQNHTPPSLLIYPQVFFFGCLCVYKTWGITVTLYKE